MVTKIVCRLGGGGADAGVLALVVSDGPLLVVLCYNYRWQRPSQLVTVNKSSWACISPAAVRLRWLNFWS